MNEIKTYKNYLIKQIKNRKIYLINEIMTEKPYAWRKGSHSRVLRRL